jgi:nucleoside-diphosphate-sugar epimerase
VKVFVTGATGFLGRHLVEYLLAAGDEVTALVRTFDRARSLPAGVRPWAGDVLRPEGLRAGLRDAEVVYHLAALRRPGRRPRDLGRLDRINVEGTRAVLALAGELGVGRVVYLSDLAVYGETRGRAVDETAAPQESTGASAYGQSKTRAHREVTQAIQRNLPVTLVCVSAIVGPGDAGWLGRLLGRYARRRLQVMLGGDSTYGFVPAASAAQGLRQAAVRGAAGQVYFLAGPALTLRQFFTAAQQSTGLPAPLLWLPAGLARLAARSLRRLRPDLAQTAHWMAGHTHLGDAAKAERELGWHAGPLAPALRASVDWHIEQERLALEAQRAAREHAEGTERN